MRSVLANSHANVSRALQPRLARGFIALLLAMMMLASHLPLQANAQGRISFVRDAEIETVLGQFLAPILQASGLGGSNITVYLINDRRFNAFVVDGRRIFINLGVIMQSETPNEIIGVLAHETGHIAGGHLARLRDQMRSAQAAVILQTILAGAAAAAGSGEAAGAIISGGGQAIQRTLLSYRRAEENAADRAAVNYLNATKQSAKGMLKTFQRFADQGILTDRFADPYARSHPMPRDRIAALQQVAERSPYYNTVDPPARQLKFDLLRAKTIAYVDHPRTVLRKYPRIDADLPSRYAHTIAQMRQSNYRAAIANADRLINAMPSNPFFHEMKGEVLINAGRPREAIAPLQRAVSLAPQNALLRVALGKAYVFTDDRSLYDDAINQLNRVIRLQRDHAEAQRYLARAYGGLGQIAQADLASAEAALAVGNFDMARQFATRAKSGFQRGQPGWLRADDILNIRTGR